jgi:hypothetical protein
MGFISNPLDPWGAADATTAYGAVFEAMAASGAYDVLVQVHDFPYKSMVAEVETADEVTRALLDSTRDRPQILPIYVSLTSGEPPPETKAVLDEQGGGAPLLRGAREAFRAIGSVTRWQARHDERRRGGPWRAEWPDLARDGGDRTKRLDRASKEWRAAAEVVEHGLGLGWWLARRQRYVDGHDRWPVAGRGEQLEGDVVRRRHLRRRRAVREIVDEDQHVVRAAVGKGLERDPIRPWWVRRAPRVERVADVPEGRQVRQQRIARRRRHVGQVDPCSRREIGDQ